MRKNPMREAIKVLREKKWIRGKLSDENPWTGEINGVCAVGAIRVAMTGNVFGNGEDQDEQDMSAAHNMMTDLVSERVGYPTALHIWNDNHAKDVDEVIELFKLGAERWDQTHE